MNTSTESASAVAEVDDEALMTRYGQGDTHAFELLYARHKQATFRFFSRQLNPESAADCHQELWFKVINAAPGYQSKGVFAAYLFTIAHNVLTDNYRRSMKHRVVDATTSVEDLDLPADTPSVESALNGAQLRARLLDLVGKLPYAQREALVLHEDCGLTLREIANVTGSSEEGIKSRLRYAMLKLKSGMSNYVES